MSPLSLSLKAFDDYIKGGRSASLKSHMAFYDKRLRRLKQDFYLSRISDEEEYIDSILDSLHISNQFKSSYKAGNPAIYDFLIRLHQDEHIQVGYLLELIEEKSAYSTLAMVLGGFLTVGVLSVVFSLPIFEGFVSFIKGFLSSGVGIPVIGVLFTLTTTGLSLYQNQTDKKKNESTRFRDNFVTLSSALLNIIAYVAWIAGGAAMSPLAAGFFITASAVEVVKGVVRLVQEYTNQKRYQVLFDENDLHINHRILARFESGKRRYRNELLINFAVAVLLVGVMVTWCLAPPSIFLSIGMISAIAAIYVAKYFVMQKSETYVRETLQDELCRIEACKPFVPMEQHERKFHHNYALKTPYREQYCDIESGLNRPLSNERSDQDQDQTNPLSY